MGKNTDQWRKIKRSLSQLSLSARATTDLTNMNVKAENEFDRSSRRDSEREPTPLFSSISTVDLDLHASAWAEFDPISPEAASEISIEEPPPRSDRRNSCGSLPPRKHPYPSSLTHAYKNYHPANKPLGLRQVLFNMVPRRRSVLFPRRMAGSSLTPPKRRGFKGISTKLRRCFSFPGLHRRRKNAPAEDESGESSDELEVMSEDSGDFAAKAETLYARVLRAAQEMDLDESTVGSIIMSFGDDTSVTGVV